jgi:hypothetical protein
MSTFGNLQDCIEKRKKAELDSSVLLKLDLDENNLNETSLEDNSLFYSHINKDIYDFRVYVISKKIPEKIKDSINHLDYNMNKYYFLNIEVNDDKNICEFTLNRSDDLNAIENDFNDINAFIKDNSIELIFDKIISKIQR